MVPNEELFKRTEKLLEYRKFIVNRFEEAKASGIKGDFYQEVKPFANEVKQKTDEWRTEALLWLKNYPQRHIHARQIESTAENLEMVSISAFFPETSRKRFLDHVQSIEFVLNGLAKAIKDIESSR
ncbi:protein of unknown function [Mesobacillus persicus]|uniref:DUF1798 family protein n=1 Tax=Mesobacillus persicus TaxID=930146 RepID=A0A1H8BM57_9BACI|nr:YppE family protein [Mesobacillus persicus]SEM83579.1 protein of unknown function [Mesobacillus persicus]